jgi:8-oxo-dGTP diphosphatase
MNYQNKNIFLYNKIPGVGVGIFIIDPTNCKLLIGKRRDSGLYGLPGGWLERSEEWEECAERELFEETGLIKKSTTFKHLYTLNCIVIDKQYHNISCIMYNEIDEEEILMIKNTEPQKCSGWFWVKISDLRKHLNQLFFPLKLFLKKFPEIQCVSHLKKMIKSDAQTRSLSETN